MADKRTHDADIFIYELRDPDSGAIRYVGRTSNPHSRYQNHLSEARNYPGYSKKSAWINELLQIGKKPLMRIAMTTNSQIADLAEFAYVMDLVKQGANLLNNVNRISRASDLIDESVAYPQMRRTLFVPAKGGVSSYKRTITASPTMYRCAKCEQETTKSVYPGRSPFYRSKCAKEVEREKTRDRVRRLRALKKAIEI